MVGVHLLDSLLITSAMRIFCPRLKRQKHEMMTSASTNFSTFIPVENRNRALALEAIISATILN